MIYNSNFDNIEYYFTELIAKLTELVLSGFDPFGISDMSETSIYIIVDKDYTISKRVSDYLYNNESVLTIEDVLTRKYYINAGVKLYGHSHHSNTGDPNNEAEYLSEILGIDPELSKFYGDSVYSKISWDKFEPGNYEIMLRDVKDNCNCYGGILVVEVDNNGDKVGYIRSNKG